MLAHPDIHRKPGLIAYRGFQAPASLSYLAEQGVGFHFDPSGSFLK